jgi:hypothetical protein
MSKLTNKITNEVTTVPDVNAINIAPIYKYKILVAYNPRIINPIEHDSIPLKARFESEVLLRDILRT